MTTDFKKLALRARACPRFEWVQGMCVDYTRTWGVVLEGAAFCDDECAITYAFGSTRDGGGLRDEKVPDDCLPNLEDPATVGCILALVRKAYGDTGIHASCRRPIAPSMSGVTPPAWFLMDGFGRRMHEIGGPFETEIDALVAALEAAP